VLDKNIHSSLISTTVLTFRRNVTFYNRIKSGICSGQILTHNNEGEALEL